MIQQSIGFIGAGNMAEAMVRGLLETKTCIPERLWAADVNELRTAFFSKSYGVHTAPSNLEMARACPLLVLAVKPQQAAAALKEIRPGLLPDTHLLLSIAAGIPTSFLEKAAGLPLKIIRAMPNTPVRLRAGATAYCLGQHAGEPENLIARIIFESIGTAVRVEETSLNAVTALSGSGPAYVFALCEMMTRAGAEMGLAAEDAERLSVQTILGAARMLAESGQKAGPLREAVTSPGGTTEAALRYLQEAGFEGIFRRALMAAKERAAALTPRDADA